MWNCKVQKNIHRGAQNPAEVSHSSLAPRRTQQVNNTWFLLFGTFQSLVIGWAALGSYSPIELTSGTVMGNSFVLIDVSMEISPRHWISPCENRSHKKPLPRGQWVKWVIWPHLFEVAYKKGYVMVNVWLSLYLVHYTLNYSFLSQTKDLRETNTMLSKWPRKA